MAFVLYPHPALRTPAPPLAGVDDALRAIGQRLYQAGVAADAYGLTGAHIGEPGPVIVVRTDGEYRVLYNPRVAAVAEETADGMEGSVSLPGVEVEIVRPVWAHLAYMDEAGTGHEERFEGFDARVALHEIEQMGGVFFLSTLSRLKRDRALKRFAKVGRPG
jgi:peptide deformylase